MGRGLRLKTAVSLLSMVSKIFELLVNNKLVDHLEKDSVFSISSIISGLIDLVSEARHPGLFNKLKSMRFRVSSIRS